MELFSSPTQNLVLPGFVEVVSPPADVDVRPFALIESVVAIVDLSSGKVAFLRVLPERNSTSYNYNIIKNNNNNTTNYELDYN